MSHEPLIKTTRQLITVVTLGFIVPIIVIVLLVKFVVGGHTLGSAGTSAMTPDAVAERIKPIGVVTVGDAGTGAAGAPQTGEAVFKNGCSACHAAGLAGAPKAGDAAAWGPRIKQGFETLVKHAIGGYKAMPPRGGNANLSDIEVARGVAYMANLAGAKFKEPAAAPAPTAPAATPAAAPVASAPAAPAMVVAAPVVTAAKTAAAPAGAGQNLYNTVCMACHATGLLGSPKFGDKAAWAPRIKTGIEALVASALHGKGAMPPKGGSSASDADVRAAVEYMVNAAK